MKAMKASGHKKCCTVYTIGNSKGGVIILIKLKEGEIDAETPGSCKCVGGVDIVI